MGKSFRQFILLFQTLIISVAMNVPNEVNFYANDIETHLNEFSQHTVAHHDNIDDTAENHSHVHKHSKDDEEHEHSHDHRKFSDITPKTLFLSKLPSIDALEVESSQGITECHLISNPHPSSIFRPPIDLTV